MSVKFSREFYGWDRFSKITTVAGIFKNTKRKFQQKLYILKKNIEPINIKKNMEIFNSLLKKYKPMKDLKEKRKYIITSCPKCEQKLRLPKGKGKIIVTCSKCCSEFRLKT